MKYIMGMNEEDFMENFNKKKVYFKALPKPALYTKENQLTVEDFVFDNTQNQNLKKDRRIKELEEEIADLKAEIEMLKAVNQEC